MKKYTLSDYLRNLFKAEKDFGKIRIIDPERLGKRMVDKAYAKNYHKLKKTYERFDLKSFIKGKKVRYWKLVKSHYDFAHDEFIPIFYNKKKRYHYKHNNYIPHHKPTLYDRLRRGWYYNKKKVMVILVIILIVFGIYYINKNKEEIKPYIQKLKVFSIEIKEKVVSEVQDVKRDEEKIELMVFDLVNKERRSKGLHSLMLSPHLTSLAKAHSKRMIEDNFFQHSGYNVGENIAEAPIYADVIGCGYIITNEDVAGCFVNSWIGSSGHYANMMSLSYANTGVGVACSSSKCRATQTFI